MEKQLVRALGLVALSIGLAACGGGGSSDTASGGDTQSSPVTHVNSQTIVGDGGAITLTSKNNLDIPATDDFVSLRHSWYDFMSFASEQDNLVIGDTNGHADVFLKNTLTKNLWKLSLADLSNAEADGPSGILPEFPGTSNLSQGTISALGDYTAFVSNATNLAGPDTNGVPDVYVRFDTGKTPDKLSYRTPRTYRVSITADGTEPTTASFSPAILSDGTIAFVTASPLIATDTNGTYDVYTKDINTGNLKLISRPGPGATSNGASFDPLPCYDGDRPGVCFLSWASNLVASDNNNSLDLFIHHNDDTSIRRLSVSAAGTEGNNGILGPSHQGQISFPSRLYDASFGLIAFLSESSNLVEGDNNNRLDAFTIDTRYGRIDRSSANYAGTASGATMNGIAVSGYRTAFTSDQAITGSQISPGSIDVYVRTYYGNSLYRISNLLTDSWPIGAVEYIQGFDDDGRLHFAGSALTLSGSLQGTFASTLP